MATPPLKRSRHQDDVGREQKVKRPHTNGHADPAASNGSRTPRVKEESPEADQKKHSRSERSRSRERHEKRKDRSKDRERKRERSRERHEGLRDKEKWKKDRDRAGRKDTEQRESRREGHRRSRSRSPISKKQEERRHRSPPRGPRSARSPSRANTSKHPGRVSPSAQSSRQSFTPLVRPSETASAPKIPHSRRQAGHDISIRLDPNRPPRSEEELEELMRESMGFGNFKTTKNTKVPGNDKLYAVRKEKKTEYRQYMNRVGGFNRPLSPTR